MVTVDNESYAKICGLLYKQPIIQEDDIKGNSILNFKKTAATNTTGGVQYKLDDFVPKYNETSNLGKRRALVGSSAILETDILTKNSTPIKAMMMFNIK
jgi:hypothetical protein